MQERFRTIAQKAIKGVDEIIIKILLKTQKELEQKIEKFSILNEVPESVLENIKIGDDVKQGIRIRELKISINKLKENFSENEKENIEEINYYLNGVKQYKYWNPII